MQTQTARGGRMICIGIAELSGPYDLQKACPNGWAEIKTETSFVKGFVDLVTSGIYAPQSVTVGCTAAPVPVRPPEPVGSAPATR